jgi:hypothetical protein
MVFIRGQISFDYFPGFNFAPLNHSPANPEVLVVISLVEEFTKKKSALR